MWIKTPQGKLVNLEKLSAVQYSAMGDKASIVILTVEGIQVAVHFKTEEEAAAYVGKLANKLGAVEIWNCFNSSVCC